MAIDTSLFVNIISQLKDKGIRDTEKGLKGLSARTNSLTRQLGVLARRVAVFETLRRSFKAFVEDEAAARRLNVTLNNLGLSFSALAAEDYIASLERTSRVLDDQLRPAFETISRATGDFAKSQEILNLALDVAAGTGADVVTVSRALSRAYSGNTTTLSRLNAGLTKAELATGDFAVIQEKLNSLFRGQNAALLDTYQGKINGLRVAFANAGEAVGKGLVDGVTALAGGDVQNAINFIVRAGEAIGDAFRFASRQVAFVKEIFTRQDFFGAESQLELFEKFRKIDDPAKIRASARERRKALEEENKTAQKIARTRAKAAAADKKAAADAKKAEQDKLKLLEAGELFDDERISIAAALKNESLDRNEILRLELKQALINENADRAQLLAERLKASQEELAKLAQFKPANPFQSWLDAIDELNKRLAALGRVTAPTIEQGEAARQVIALGEATGNQAILDSGVNMLSDWLNRGEDAALAEFLAAERAGLEADISGARVQEMASTVNVYVQGTGGLDDQTKKAIVDTIIDYSSIGYSTSGWYRTTGNIAL